MYSQIWRLKIFKNHQKTLEAIQNGNIKLNKNFHFNLKGRKVEEQRSQRLSAELSQLRHETERRLAEKDEEIESIR